MVLSAGVVLCAIWSRDSWISLRLNDRTPLPFPNIFQRPVTNEAPVLSSARRRMDVRADLLLERRERVILHGLSSGGSAGVMQFQQFQESKGHANTDERQRLSTVSAP